MDGTTVIKVEENHCEDEDSCSVDPSLASTVSKSVPTFLQQTDCEPLKIIPPAIDSFVVKSKRKQSLRRHLLRNCEESESSTKKDTLQIQASLVPEVAKAYQCQLCISDGKELEYFASKNGLLVHMSIAHHSTNRFECLVCHTQFNYLINLKLHTRVHSKVAPTALKCEMCSETYITLEKLNLHLVQVHKYSSEKLNVKEFHCDMCSKLYYKKSDLERHVVETHVVDKPLECHVCSKTFIDQGALSAHLRKHDRQPCHVCDVCSKAYQRKEVLLRHLGVEHHKFFRCDKCKTSFSIKSEFDAHSDQQLEIQYKCQICNKLFPTQCSLNLDIQFHNSTEFHNLDCDLKSKKISNNFDEFKCELCSKTFDRASYLVAHRNQVHPSTEWPCSKCSKTFRLHYKMKQHEVTYKEVRPHQCKFCDKSYCGRKDLKVHENSSHLNKKRLKCQLCSFQTTDDREVAAHYSGHGFPKVTLQRIS